MLTGQEAFPTKYLLHLIVKSFNGVSVQQAILVQDLSKNVSNLFRYCRITCLLKIDHKCLQL